MSLILYVYLVNETSVMPDDVSVSLNSSLEESFCPRKSILQTSILQDNRFDEEHVKHLSMRNMGMLWFRLLFFYLDNCQHLLLCL
jgi:hypothetical protein